MKQSLSSTYFVVKDEEQQGNGIERLLSFLLWNVKNILKFSMSFCVWISTVNLTFVTDYYVDAVHSIISVW